MTLEKFTAFVRGRRATRNFKPDPVSDELLMQLIECARWAPSGFNLQPTHFVIVTDPEKKKKLLRSCLYQRQVVEAPALIVFTGDRKAFQHNMEAVIEQEEECGNLTHASEDRLRRFAHLNFDQGFFGLTWIAKAFFGPLLRLFTPLPHLPAVHKRFWLTKQVMLSVMNTLLAAEAAGLSCSPIEGFDEWRVKYHLGIPYSHIVPMIVCVGYSLDQEVSSKTRLPLDEKVHRDIW